MASQMFLKLGDDIKGETTDEHHSGWMEILSFDHGVNQPVSSASGTGGRTGAAADFSPFSFTKILDSASPDLMHHCAAGKLIKKAEVHCCQAFGDENASHVYLSYELGNVIVSSYTPGGGGGDKPMESVTLGYGSISMAYTPLDDEQATGSEAKRGWDVQKNKTL